MSDNNQNRNGAKPANGKNGAENGKNNYRKNKNYKKKQKNNSSYVPPYDPVLMAKPISETELSEKTAEILIAGGVDTVGKICSRMAKEMYFIQHVGKKQLNEVSQVLKKMNVDFRPSDVKEVSVVVEKIVEVADKKEKTVVNQKNDQKEKCKDKPLKGKQTKDFSEKPIESRKVTDSKKDKAKDNEPFDVRRIFPREPFAPTPPRTVEPDRFVKFQKGGKWGFKDKNGKELIPPIYDEVFNFKEDVACVERKELFGYITRDNEMIIPYKYEVASSFSEGLACVGNDSKCGYINKAGEVVIPFIFDAGTPFVNGVAQVKQNDRWGTYDLKTKEVDWSN